MISTPSSGLTHSIPIRTSLFIGLNLIDFVSTVILTNLRLGFEGNPLLGNESWSIALVKVAAMIIFLYFFRNRKGIMWPINIGLGLVVLWNLTWLVILL